MSKIRSKSKVVKALERKGFKKNRMKKHIHYIYYDLQDRISVVNTQFSHESKDLGDELISRIASQLKLSNRQFSQLVDCSMTQSQYNDILKNKNLL